MDDPSPHHLAAIMGELAVQMHDSRDPQATAATIVAAANVIPGISWAGVTLIRGETVIPTAPTDDVARDLNLLQGQLGEGPTLDALTHHHTVVINDLRTETRWPRFAHAATARGVRCMAAFRLFLTNRELGALTLYGPHPDVFDDDAVLYGQILSQHAAVAIAGAQAEEQLQRAVASRDVIGQAKGIIMERFHVPAVRAFEMLTRLSQESNVKLLQIAQQVIATTDTT